ncbi:kinase-like domain-containing protein [Gaertneriomyces semiglobifer]|nr:kinase-like domain-containing protein [Gaertneriomyces semiglobifer]
MTLLTDIDDMADDDILDDLFPELPEPVEDVITQATQISPLDSQIPLSNSTPSGRRAWGILKSLNSDYPTVKLYEKPQGGPKWKRGGYLIGRHRECDVKLDGPLVISNRHCLIFRRKAWKKEIDGMEEQVFIQDLSTNGTYVNGENLKRKIQRLYSGDRIQLAKCEPDESLGLANDNFYRFIIPKPPQSESLEDKYIMGEILGSGNYSTVRLALDRETEEQVAVKILSKSKIKTQKRFLEHISEEVSLLSGLRHENIVSIKSEYSDSENIYIVLEYIKGGELFDRISARPTGIGEDLTRTVMAQIFEALAFLHDRDITHRDLKPENILMVSRDPDDWRIKITDFGLAKETNQAYMGTLCGTPHYVAPEIFGWNGERRYNKLVDLWSCGVIMFVCICGYPPFSDEVGTLKMQEQIRKGNYQFLSPWWDNVSDDAKALVKGLLSVNANDRPTAHASLKHPYFTAFKTAPSPSETSSPVRNTAAFTRFSSPIPSMESWSVGSDGGTPRKRRREVTPTLNEEERTPSRRSKRKARQV